MSNPVTRIFSAFIKSGLLQSWGIASLAALFKKVKETNSISSFGKIRDFLDRKFISSNLFRLE